MLLTLSEIEKLQRAMDKHQTEAAISLDLGLTLQNVKLQGGKALFPDRRKLDIHKIKRLDANSCYVIQDDGLVKAQIYSERTQRHYKLVPTKDWPTATISGVPMHQKTRVTPQEDAHEKTSAVEIHGAVLDTCTGLGYTAILAAQKAERVVSVEYDAQILELARLNPYSRELFANKTIQLVRGDVRDVIRTFKDNEFDVIIHDPPTFKLAGELFGREFYREAYRVLKKSGWMFHYTGRFGIKSGRRFIEEVIKRLKEVGFTTIRKVMDEQGVVCQKP